MPETAVVVLVPAADPAVMQHAREHTASGAQGLGAHVTVLYPFVEADLLDAGVLVALREELAGFRRFPLTLTRLLRFPPSPATLYLAPEPAAPFADMTRRVAGRFGLQPYGGGHDQVVPHLTVAMGDDQALLDRIERDVASRLPIATTVEAVHVIAHAGDRWGVAHEIRLAP